MTEGSLTLINVDVVITTGTDINTAITDAIIFAGKYDCKVRFVFNNTTFVVDKNTNAKEYLKKVGY